MKRLILLIKWLPFALVVLIVLHCRHNNNALANFIRVFLWHFSESDAIYISNVCFRLPFSSHFFPCVGFSCVPLVFNARLLKLVVKADNDFTLSVLAFNAIFYHLFYCCHSAWFLLHIFYKLYSQRNIRLTINSQLIRVTIHLLLFPFVFTLIVKSY